MEGSSFCYFKPYQHFCYSILAALNDFKFPANDYLKNYQITSYIQALSNLKYVLTCLSIYHDLKNPCSNMGWKCHNLLLNYLNDRLLKKVLFKSSWFYVFSDWNELRFDCLIWSLIFLLFLCVNFKEWLFIGSFIYFY